MASSATLVLTGGLIDIGGGHFATGDLVIRDERIDACGPGAGEGVAGERVDCRRFAIVPGLVNAHNHSNENWFRGRWDKLPLEPWMLFSYPVLAGPAQSPREVYVRTLLGGLEMLHSGATCVVDFLYETPGHSEASLDAVVQAYRDLGLRAVVALGIGDRAYHETVVLEEGLVPGAILARLRADAPPRWPELEAAVRAAVARHHRPDEGISIAIAPSGPQRCTDALLTGAAALADELDLQIHIHLLETRMQALSGRRMYGVTLPEHLREIGFLGPRVSLAHAVWLTDADIEIVRASGASVVHNPVSNLKLGSGLSPVPAMLEAGINVAIGTDGMASNDSNDMFALLKLAGLLHKVWDVDIERWIGAEEAWRMATAGGARAAGHADTVGELAPGRRADLVLLDLESRVFTPMSRPLGSIVFGSTTAAVHSAMVAGRWVLRDGRISGVDEPAILAEAREIAPGLLGSHEEAWQISDALLEAVRQGWREARRADVGVERRPPLR